MDKNIAKKGLASGVQQRSIWLKQCPLPSCLSQASPGQLALKTPGEYLLGVPHGDWNCCAPNETQNCLLRYGSKIWASDFAGFPGCFDATKAAKPPFHHLCNCRASEEEALENSGDLPSQSFRHLVSPLFHSAACLVALLMSGLSLQEGKIGVT